MESEIAEFVSYSAYFLTIVFNSILIYLTAYHTKRFSITYRHMIIGFALLGIGFSTLDIVVRPIMHSYNGCFLYFSLEGMFQSSKAITEILLAVYSAVYSSILSFLTVQYIFRTCLVMKPSLISYFRGWRCVFWLGYVYVFGFAWGFITYVYAYPDLYARDYVRDEMYEQYRVDSYDVPLFVLLAYGEKNVTKFVRFQSLVCIFGDMGIMALQYVIMMTCGVLLYKKITWNLRQAETIIAFSQVHKQFFKALVYQVIEYFCYFFFNNPKSLAGCSISSHSSTRSSIVFFPFIDMKISFRTRIVVYFFSIYQFAYRACLVVFRKRAKHFEGKKYALWLIYVLFCGFVWSCIAYEVSPDELTDAYLRSEILSNYRVEIRNVANFVILAYNGEGNTKRIRWNSVICIVGVSILLGFQYMVMMLSGILMYRRTHGTTATSFQQEKLQKQLFVDLIYQVVTPTIIFQLPAFVVLTAPFFDFRFSFHSGIIIYGFSAYPLIDTLIVFKVITEYKNAYKSKE